MSVKGKWARLVARARRLFGMEETPEHIDELAAVITNQGAPATPRQVEAVVNHLRENPDNIPMILRSRRAQRYGSRRYRWGHTATPFLCVLAICSAVAGALIAVDKLWPLRNPGGFLVFCLVCLGIVVWSKRYELGLARRPFVCPDCGAKYPAFYDGHDCVCGKVGLCSQCAAHHQSCGGTFKGTTHDR